MQLRRCRWPKAKLDRPRSSPRHSTHKFRSSKFHSSHNYSSTLTPSTNKCMLQCRGILPQCHQHGVQLGPWHHCHQDSHLLTGHIPAHNLTIMHMVPWCLGMHTIHHPSTSCQLAMIVMATFQVPGRDPAVHSRGQHPHASGSGSAVESAATGRTEGRRVVVVLDRPRSPRSCLEIRGRNPATKLACSSLAMKAPRAPDGCTF
mmetsp:Transcript_53032/g.119273  ORF Transcript_53032/g.119273 Transcript_53032/m.119273 type:complete len:203 (+) Transcript_53032:1420-2028(+)